MIREDEGERDIDKIIDKAQPGDIIYLSDGTYCSYESSFNISKPLTLIAKNLPTLRFRFDVEKGDVKYYFNPYPSVKIEHHPPTFPVHTLDITADHVSLIGLATPTILTPYTKNPEHPYAQYTQTILCDIANSERNKDRLEKEKEIRDEVRKHRFFDWGIEVGSYSKAIGCCIGDVIDWDLFLYGNYPYANFVYLKDLWYTGGEGIITWFGFKNAEVANAIEEAPTGTSLPRFDSHSQIFDSTIRNSYLFDISGDLRCNFRNFWIKDSELRHNYLSTFYPNLKEERVTHDMETVPVEHQYLHYTNKNGGWVDIQMLLEELGREAWWEKHRWEVAVGVAVGIGICTGILGSILTSRQ